MFFAQYSFLMLNVYLPLQREKSLFMFILASLLMATLDGAKNSFKRKASGTMES